MENTVKRSEWNYRLAGFIAGCFMVAGHFYSPLALLQLFAFLPIMYGTLKYDAPRTQTVVAGLYMAIFCVLPQIAYLRMPVVVTLILLVYMMVIIIAHSFVISLLVKQSAVKAALLTGIVMYMIDYLSCTLVPVWGLAQSLVPVWGLAQSLVRPWSAYPLAIGFISITGICGVMFVIAALQVLAAHYLAGEGNKKGIIAAAVVLLLFCGAGSYFTMPDETETLRVATVGWVLDENNDDSNPATDIGFEKLFVVPATAAAEQGARVITSGELGFYYNNFTKDEVLGRFFDFAKDKSVWLIIGVFDITANQNKILFISPDGEIVQDYVKTYMTPLEPGKRGDGHLKTVVVDGFDVGGMICQDDNFYQQTSTYGRAGTGLVICPTADWTTVREAHYQAVKSRAIENRYSIVRAAACGISAIISPTGEVLAEMDHFNEGPGMLIADVPVCTERTVFSQYGFAMPFAIAGIGGVLICTRTKGIRN